MRAVRIFLVVSTLLAGLAFAQVAGEAEHQQPLSDTDIALLRQDMQSTRMEIVTKNMEFTPDQQSKFWPLYREYEHAMQPIGDKKVALMKQYARDYNTMSNEQAEDLTKQLMKINDQEQELRRDYFSKFVKAVGAKTAARFYQVDNRINMLLNLRIASYMPMIH